MGKPQELALTQMRKSVEKLGSSSENYGEATLMRFLVARAMDPDKAAKMFVQWQRWRADFVPLGYIPECQVADELEARKVFLHGPSKLGFPVLIVKPSKHVPSKDQLQFKRYVVHLLDKALASSSKEREMGNEKLVGILDLKHFGYKNLDVRGLITGFQFVEAYYPERLGKVYILYMPQFFVSVWRLISRFIDKASLAKIVIVNNEEERVQFIREVGEDILPEEYGGKSKCVALQDVEVNPLGI